MININFFNIDFFDGSSPTPPPGPEPEPTITGKKIRLHFPVNSDELLVISGDMFDWSGEYNLNGYGGTLYLDEGNYGLVYSPSQSDIGNVEDDWYVEMVIGENDSQEFYNFMNGVGGDFIIKFVGSDWERFGGSIIGYAGENTYVYAAPSMTSVAQFINGVFSAGGITFHFEECTNKLTWECLDDWALCEASDSIKVIVHERESEDIATVFAEKMPDCTNCTYEIYGQTSGGDDSGDDDGGDDGGDDTPDTPSQGGDDYVTTLSESGNGFILYPKQSSLQSSVRCFNNGNIVKTKLVGLYGSFTEEDEYMQIFYIPNENDTVNGYIEVYVDGDGIYNDFINPEWFNKCIVCSGMLQIMHIGFNGSGDEKENTVIYLPATIQYWYSTGFYYATNFTLRADKLNFVPDAGAIQNCGNFDVYCKSEYVSDWQSILGNEGNYDYNVIAVD